MDKTEVLQILDRERQTVAGLGTRLETKPNVVRAIGPAWSGIAFSHFSAAEADAVIDGEIEHWSSLNRSFEWKVYSHDEPSDLIVKLR